MGPECAIHAHKKFVWLSQWECIILSNSHQTLSSRYGFCNSQWETLRAHILIPTTEQSFTRKSQPKFTSAASQVLSWNCCCWRRIDSSQCIAHKQRRPPICRSWDWKWFFVCVLCACIILSSCFVFFGVFYTKSTHRGMIFSLEQDLNLCYVILFAISGKFASILEYSHALNCAISLVKQQTAVYASHIYKIPV